MSGFFSAITCILLMLITCIASHYTSATNSNPISEDEIYSQLIETNTPIDKRNAAPVLLLLIDNLRWDIFDQYRMRSGQELPGFSHLKRMGGYVERIKPVFPAECYPNLLSIVTGRYPKEHGLLFTTMYNEADNHSFTFDGRSPKSKSKWVSTSRLWNLEPQGGKAYYFHFPLCGPDQLVEPNCEPYAEHHMNPAALNRTLSRALGQLMNGTIEVAVVYYDQLDKVGHTEGPLSDALLLDTLPKLDQVVHDLVQHIHAIHPGVHLILTSDHGMTNVRGDELLDRFISRNQVKKVINRGSTVGIWPHLEHYDQTYRRLDGLPLKHFSVYNHSKVPASWHTGGRLFPPILLVAETGYLIQSNHWPIELSHYDPTHPYKGAHGYDVAELDMHVPLFVFGPRVRSGVTYQSQLLDQLHTYKLLTMLSRPHVSNDLEYHAPSRATFWSSLKLTTHDTLLIGVTLGVLCIFLCLALSFVGIWKLFCSRSSRYSTHVHTDGQEEYLVQSEKGSKVLDHPYVTA